MHKKIPPKNIKKLQSTAANQNEQSIFSTKQVHFPTLMLQFEGAKQRLLSRLHFPWYSFWVLRLCSSPPQSWFWRITPPSLRTGSAKWSDVMEPRSVNERLSYDIVSFAIWFWPAHERGEGLLVKLCRRERGQKLFDVKFWSKNIGWMWHLTVQPKTGMKEDQDV